MDLLIFLQQMQVCTWIWLGVFGKRSKPVDGIDDKVLLQCKVGQSHWLWAINDKHNIQGTTTFLAVCKAKAFRVTQSRTTHQSLSATENALTTAAACLPDVVHDITFLQVKNKSDLYVILCCMCICVDKTSASTFVEWQDWKSHWWNRNKHAVKQIKIVLTVRPGSPSGPEIPCQV